MLRFLVRDDEVVKVEEQAKLFQELKEGKLRDDDRIMSPQEFAERNMKEQEDENPFACW